MRPVLFLLFLVCIANADLYSKPLNLNVHAESAILINADTGAILYEKEARKLQFPASTTKIATVMYALEMKGYELEKQLTADNDSLAWLTDEEMRKANYNPPYRLVPGHTHMGIKNGEILTLQALLYGTMVVSACEASNMVAKYVGGTIPKFMDQLNDYLQSIGCMNTTFKNPHGLYHPEHKTTAYDLAMMTRIAMQNPTFCEIVKTVRYTRPETNKQKESQLIQINKLLKAGKLFYSNAIGVKTGHFSIARYNLVAAAKSGDRTLIAVLLKSDEKDEHFRDAKKMFEAAFAEKKMRKTLLSAGPQEATLLLETADNPIRTYLKEPVFLDYYPSEEPKIKCFLEWNKLVLPIQKDQPVAFLHFNDASGKVLFSRPLLAQEKVSASWTKSTWKWIKTHPWISFGLATCFLPAGLLFIRRR